MGNLSILRTDGKCDDILKEYGDDVLHLFISSAENLNSASEHEIGDLLISDKYEHRFGLLVKEYMSGKIISEALMVSVMNLLNHVKENDMKQKYILISNNEFNSTREEAKFLCTFKQLILFKENEYEYTIIITDYK